MTYSTSLNDCKYGRRREWVTVVAQIKRDGVPVAVLHDNGSEIVAKVEFVSEAERVRFATAAKRKFPKLDSEAWQVSEYARAIVAKAEDDYYKKGARP